MHMRHQGFAADVGSSDAATSRQSVPAHGAESPTAAAPQEQAAGEDDTPASSATSSSHRYGASRARPASHTAVLGYQIAHHGLVVSALAQYWSVPTNFVVPEEILVRQAAARRSRA